MTRDDFRDAMLAVMEHKHHPSWPHFTSGRVKKERLHVHLEQEYEVYVRDFPVLVGRAYVQCPIPAVRRELAENLYEEETGGLAAGRPHPELFLEYPRGLGFDLSRFSHVTLLPGAKQYRSVLDTLTQQRGWAVAAAVVTVFIEGTANEREVLFPPPVGTPSARLEAHPLVVHYGLPVECLALTKAHQGIEKLHRAAAWRVMLEHVPHRDYPSVLRALEEALAAWHGYRDDVAAACGVEQ